MSEVLGVVYKNHREEIQVRGTVHEGRDYLDIRVFMLTDEGKGGADAKPTGRGVTLRLYLLPELIQALEKARPYCESRLPVETDETDRHLRQLEAKQPSSRRSGLRHTGPSGPISRLYDREDRE